MDISILIIVAILLLFSVGALIILLQYLKVNRLNSRGKGAHKITERILRKYSLLRNFKVLTDLTFSVDGELIPVETMLVGFFGILIVNTCGARGEYYGKIDEPEWIFVLDSKKNLDHKETMKNPLFIQNKAIRALRKEFATLRIYNVDIDRAVVFTNQSKKTAVFITQENLLFKQKDFKHYLNRVKFDKDHGVDVEKISEAIVSLSQRIMVKKP